MTRWNTSGSSCSASSIDPFTSAKSTVTCLRSPSRAAFDWRILSARCLGVYARGWRAGARSVVEPTRAPQPGQYLADALISALQAGHASAPSRTPHSSQKLAVASFGCWQRGQCIRVQVRSSGSPALCRCRNRMLRRPLESVAQHAGEVQEYLRGDPRIPAFHALEEALVDRQHLDVRPGDDVRRAPHAVPDECHLAEDVAALVLGDAPAMTGPVARPALGAPVEDHEHLVARVALAHDRLPRLEAPHLAHEHDHARLRRAQPCEQRDRARRIVAEPQADEVPERDDL